MTPEPIQRGSPPHTMPIGWQSLVKALGHVWTSISFISFWLFGLVAKVQDSVKVFFGTGNSKNTKTNSIKQAVIINPDQPNLKPIFEEHLLDQLADQKKEQEGTSIKEEQARNKTSSPKEEKQNPIEIKIEEKPRSPQIEVSPAAVIVVKKPSVIDVPDDGNCLFYASGIGLRTKYKDIPEIQEKLQWNVDTQLLTENLSKNEPLLREPGVSLRRQAAAYLENHLAEEEVYIGLLGGIGDYVEVAHRKIQEEESAIQILLEDINTLKQWLQQFGNTKDNYQLQIQQKEGQIAQKRASIAETEKNLPNDENLQGYIDRTKEDHVYCGAAQVYAIAKFYHVPIAIVSRYGEKDQQEDIYNAESPLQPIKLAFVNGNHYRYINS